MAYKNGNVQLESENKFEAPGASQTPGSSETWHASRQSYCLCQVGSDLVANTCGWKRTVTVVLWGKGEEWAAAHADHRFKPQTSSQRLSYLSVLSLGAFGSWHKGIVFFDVISSFTGKTGSPIKVDLICPFPPLRMCYTSTFPFSPTGLWNVPSPFAKL